MAEAITINVKGIDTATVKLIKFADDVQNLKGFGSSIAKDIVTTASAMAPRVTGALASSIGSTQTDKGVQIYAGNESVPYAGVIEYGWPAKGKPEKPYLRPAVYNNMDAIIKNYEDGIRETIRQYNLD